MKIMIAYPPIPSPKGTPLLSQNRQFQYFHNPSFIFPLIPASAATLLKSKGYEVIYKDGIAERLTPAAFFAFAEREKPDLIALETKTPVVKYHWKFIRELSRTGNGNRPIRTVLMGDHVTALPEESMKNSNVDFVLTGGDFDFMLLDLCEYLEGKKNLVEGFWYRERGGIRNTGKFKVNRDLNELPIIDRELSSARFYNVEHNIKARPFAYTMAGRDCPYHLCKFCSWPTLFPEFRTRSPESLLDEIGMLIERYRVKEIFDDTGTFPPGEWLNQFCRGMIERGYHKKTAISCNMRVNYLNPENAALMKAANFRLLKIGLESGNQETLDTLEKGITVDQIINACKIAKKAGLHIHLTAMTGYPWETRAQALKTYELAKHLMTTGLAELLQATIVIPYPGTPLHQMALDHDWFRFPPDEYERFDMSEPVLKTPDMTPDEVMRMCNRIYGIFRSPRYILRKLFSIRSWNDICYYAKGARAVLGHHRDFSRKSGS